MGAASPSVGCVNGPAKELTATGCAAAPLYCPAPNGVSGTANPWLNLVSGTKLPCASWVNTGAGPPALGALYSGDASISAKDCPL